MYFYSLLWIYYIIVVEIEVHLNLPEWCSNLNTVKGQLCPVSPDI
jgi:hypothetical protein